jgi:ATP-dependent exoDNAse (exonuclease V) beta subunit
METDVSRGGAMKTVPVDHEVRERFAGELERNFSVIAPAGVGKTTLIVERVVRMATQDPERAVRDLPSLVVVTYTNKAAQEMQQRARVAIAARVHDGRVVAAFNQAFFGTIHSFCLLLLRRHGHVLGLPEAVSLVPDEERLWDSYVRARGAVVLREPSDAGLFRFFPVTDFLKLARSLRPAPPGDAPGERPPVPDLSAIEEFETNKTTHAKIEKSRLAARRWVEQLGREGGFQPLPVCASGSKPFVAEWNRVWQSWREWIRAMAVHHALAVAGDYRRFRMGRGELTFADQIELAAALFEHPAEARQIRQNRFRVVLDEAQDTDPVQFQVLLEVARPVEAKGRWAGGVDGPEPGRFCMVGDPQQSIYGDRADLGSYLEIQDWLVAAGAEKLRLEVTFRCAGEVVSHVNRSGRSLLDGTNGQVAYEPLTPAAGAPPGQVVCVRIEETDEPAETMWEKQRVEARQLADWLHRTGLDGLQARDWSRVAVLCPRKRWFVPLVTALQDQGFRVQIQSTHDIRRDRPAVRWMAALSHVLAHPSDAFETAGVLRDVFGLSDRKLAEYVRGDAERLVPGPRHDSADPVGSVLVRLGELAADVRTLPLYEAVVRVIAVTRLDGRLAVLPEEAAPTWRSDLDRILVEAARSEVKGMSWPDWADFLRRSLEEASDEPAADAGSIQLITCQKAKGLEWDAVVLPFLFRKIGERSPGYPRVVAQRPFGALVVALSKEDKEADAGPDRAKMQENQRLLYVAMTRARRTLVLVDDRVLFSKDKLSFAVIAGEDGALFDQAVKQPRPVSFREDRAAETVVRPVGSGPETLAKAVEHASVFIRRVLPSKLAHESGVEEPEVKLDLAPEEAAARGRAIGYGTWWHEMCERMPWADGAAAWQRVWEEMAGQCPDRDRGIREWTLLQACRPLMDLLGGQENRVYAEWPVLFPKEVSMCVEGIVDVAVFCPRTDSWTVIDWKTDQTGEEGPGLLIGRYGVQIGAYVEALEAMTGRRAVGTIYATRTGEWMELAR